MRRPTLFAVIVVVISLDLFCARQSAAELIHVVSPSAYADVEANAGGSDASSQLRMQQVFPALDFASLSGPVTITQFAWRPDGQHTTPFQGTYQNITVKFSTTSAEPGNLSMTFADNIGADEVVVISATGFAMSSNNLGPAGGPKEFDMIYTFETPFTYDPSQGNLLMDKSWRGYEGEFSWDQVQDAGAGGQNIGAGDPEASAALWSNGSIVTRFTVVPEPSTITLFTMFGMVGAFVVWRKRK